MIVLGNSMTLLLVDTHSPVAMLLHYDGRKDKACNSCCALSGDWFCPVCIKELGQQGIDVLGNTHHMVNKNKTGNKTTMVDILGCQSQESMSAVDRLAILLKICECSLGTNKLRCVETVDPCR